MKATAKTKSRRVRRTQQERSSETREKLLQSTIEVLIERGYNGLSLAQVHEQAGLSSGARVHHYRTKADLVIAATAFAYEKAIEAGRHLAEKSFVGSDPLAGFIADSRTIYFDWPFIVALEILVPARTDPTLAAKIKPIMERYRNTTNETWRAVFCNAGFSPKQADRIINLTLNLIRGMAINSVWQSDPQHYEEILADWRGLIAAAVTREPSHRGRA